MARNIVKSVDHQIKECVKKMSEDDLKWFSIRLKERIGGDLGEALLLIQENYGELNRVLSNSPNAETVYDVADLIDKYIQEELKKRSTTFRPAKAEK